jgi:hypothetical protein
MVVSGDWVIADVFGGSKRGANTEFIAISANHAAAVAQAYIDAMQERDYWRTIAQEGVGGLPLEGDSNDLAAIDAALDNK